MKKYISKTNKIFSVILPSFTISIQNMMNSYLPKYAHTYDDIYLPVLWFSRLGLRYGKNRKQFWIRKVGCNVQNILTLRNIWNVEIMFNYLFLRRLDGASASGAIVAREVFEWRGLFDHRTRKHFARTQNSGIKNRNFEPKQKRHKRLWYEPDSIPTRHAVHPHEEQGLDL